MAMSIADEIDPMAEFIPREIQPKPFRPEDIDPAKVVVSFDRRSDTLLIHLFGRGRDSVSVPVENYLYIMVDPESEVIVGFHIEGFLGQAVKDVPAAIDLLDYAELRGITPAEVRELQRETLGPARHCPAYLSKPNGKSVPEQRKQAIAHAGISRSYQWSEGSEAPPRSRRYVACNRHDQVTNLLHWIADKGVDSGPPRSITQWTRPAQLDAGHIATPRRSA